MTAADVAFLHAQQAEVIDTTAPLAVARAFVESRSGVGQLPNLVHWQGDFWHALATHYEELEINAAKAELYAWLDQQSAVVVTKVKSEAGEKLVEKIVRVKPNKRLVESVIDAMKAAAHINVKDAPAWLRNADVPPAGEIIACANGLLHVPTRRLLPLSRNYFNQNGLSFDFLPQATTPSSWHSFLSAQWHDDPQSTEALQEFFGLALTSETRHQKALLIVGPPRSGKGTIARVLGELVGKGNFTAPTLSGIGQQFGKESLIGKTLAIVSDARISNKADISSIAETLLRITGEDAISVPRKFKPDWTAPLKTRFLILTNELPAFQDHSGALAKRFIVLQMTKSFLGNEDQGLTDRLISEMPGIMLWALKGLDRLRKRGRFVQPESANEMVRELETLASPIKSFVAEKCILSPGASIECDRLFQAWGEWTKQAGREHAGTVQMFGRNLKTAFPTIKGSRPREGGSRARHYDGIRLRDITDPEDDAP